MPENAAAEGGYGLSASEAFGGRGAGYGDAAGARDEVIARARDEVALEKQNNTSGPRINNPAMQYRQMLAERFGGMRPQGVAQQTPTGFGGKGALTVAQPPEVTPEMRNEALRIFESQRGAGQVPYQMMPYQQGLGSMPPPQGLSPAFQYAAENYQRLGGSQRLMDRPMEMMSVAERQRINDMAQGMAGMQRPTMSSGKGNVAQQPEVVGRMLPFISQMGLASLRGTGMPPQ